MRIPSGLEAWATRVKLPRLGIELFCYDAGRRDAPGLLLVHGLGDEADTWRRVIGPLSEGHRVVAPDLPGFGRSPRRGPGWLSPRYLGGVLLELLAELGMQGVTLIGSSLGAALSQVAALRDPSRISRLVLVDGGLLAMGGRPNRAVLAMLLPVLGERRYRSLEGNLDAAFASLIPYYGNLRRLPPEERQFLRERVGERVASRTQMRAYFSSLRSFTLWMLAGGKASVGRAAGLAIPTTYVWGEQDHIVAPEAGRQAHARHEGSSLVLIPNAGHLPHQEAPLEFLRVIRAE